jgi:flagellar biosynthesis component FlhA
MPSSRSETCRSSLALILCSILAPEGQYGTIRYNTVVTVESYDIEKEKEEKEKEEKDEMEMEEEKMEDKEEMEEKEIIIRCG